MILEDFISKNYNLFPVNLFYKTSNNKKLLLSNKNSVYIYSIHKVSFPEVKISSIVMQYFKVYECIDPAYSKPVGFVFKPTLPKGCIIRYTPYAVVATTKNVTSETFDSSSKDFIFSDDNISILNMSCGCEIISDLSSKLGIFMGD